MHKQNATGNSGILARDAGNLFNCPRCILFPTKFQPVDDLLAQAARRMGEAEKLGDYAGYIVHFSIWLELCSLRQRWIR